MKTLAYKEIIKGLSEGNALRYAIIYAKAHVVTPDGAILGAVRFDTYLKLIRQKTVTKARATYSYEYFALTKEAGI
jgi:beta-N-acetylglucosaminidase